MAPLKTASANALFCCWLLAVASAIACEAAPDTRPNVVWIVLDAAAADHTSVHDSELGTTPHLARLAAEGLSWRGAYAQAPHTLGSVSSYFTGLYPGDAAPELRIAAPTIAERMQSEGYRTASFLENPWLDSKRGFDRGFDRAEVIGSSWVVRGEPSPTIDRVLAELDAAGAAPYFLYVHLISPHTPYQPPPPHLGRFSSGLPEPPARASLGLILTGDPTEENQAAHVRLFLGEETVDPQSLDYVRARYRDNLNFADARVGELLDGLRARGELDRTLVIVTSDHGEAIGEHGDLLHGTSVYDEQIRVPLIMRLPLRFSRDNLRGVSRAEPVELLDLAATILHVTGVAADDVTFGRGASLLGSRAGRPVRSFKDPDWQTVIEAGTKLIIREGVSPMLFDLAADPDELDDLAARRPESVARLRAKLWRTGAGPSPEVGGIDGPTRAELESLGYLDEGPVSD